MILPKECVAEYADIFKAEFGICLSNSVAEKKAKNLLKLSEKLIYIKTKGNP
ncbi:MAG: hypothetical protein KGO93_07595 [Cyanobacteria bacterium REEB446]|nr:hypothetical protein [Cyanobacteria bacterium REEB446]